MSQLSWMLLLFLSLTPQSDLIRVDEGANEFQLPPRRAQFFQHLMTEGYQIILNWETDGEEITFWICSPKWRHQLPPPQDTIAYHGEGHKMSNYRFKATQYGVWTFIFYNDHVDLRPLHVHWAIFKEVDAPAVSSDGSPSQSTLGLFNPVTVFVGIVGICLILGITKGVLMAPKETARERRIRQWKERRQK